MGSAVCIHSPRPLERGWGWGLIRLVSETRWNEHGSRGVAEFTKTVAEFTKNASEGVLLLHGWRIFCKFAMSFQPKWNDSTTMTTKTIKNSLLQSVAYGPHAAFMALRLKANFHASPAAIMALLAKHRLHQCKNIALRAEKHISSSNLLSLSLTSSLVLFLRFL